MTNNVIGVCHDPVRSILCGIDVLPKEFAYSKTAEQKVLITDKKTLTPFIPYPAMCCSTWIKKHMLLFPTMSCYAFTASQRIVPFILFIHLEQNH